MDRQGQRIEHEHLQVLLRTEHHDLDLAEDILSSTSIGARIPQRPC